MLLTDVVLAVVGLLVFPLVIVSNLVFQRFQSPLMTRVQALRAELSEIAHESFDGALVVKSLGREGEETDAVRRQGAHPARHEHPGRRGPRDLRPRARGAAQPRRPRACSSSGSWRVESGATDPGDVVNVAYLLMVVAFPIRSLGWLLGEFPRSVVGFDRVRSVLRGDRRDAVRRRAAVPPHARTAPGVEVEHVGFAYDRRWPCSTT